MHIRIYFRKMGGHIHCRVFSGQTKTGTFAKCGDLTFNEREWEIAHDLLLIIAEVIPEMS